MKKEEDLIYLRKYDEHCKLQLNSKILIIVKSKVKCVKRYAWVRVWVYACGNIPYPRVDTGCDLLWLISVALFYILLVLNYNVNALNDVLMTSIALTSREKTAGKH